MLIILGIVSGIIALLVTVFGLTINLNSLNSKTDIGEVLLTDEQKLKVYYYRKFMLSLILAFEAFCIFTFVALLLDAGQTELTSKIIGSALATAFGVFLLCLASLDKLAQLYQNFFIKDHYKFRVTLSGIGDVFIIRMLNAETCICSKDPNAGFKENSKRIYLIPIQDIMREPLLKTKHPKLPKTLKQKILN